MDRPPVAQSIVDGNTKIIGIAGHPIAQVLTPSIMSALCRANGVNALCVPFHVEPASFPALLEGLRGMHNLLGVIATVPHKREAAALADIRLPRAAQAHAANVLRRDENGRFSADMLDGVGFIAALRAAGHEPASKRALVAGAGGVATAICFALADAKAAEIALFDADTARAEDLVARLLAVGANARLANPDPTGYNLVLNATPLGMRADDPFSIDPTHIDPTAIAADVVSKPAITKFLLAAQARGCAILPGARMTEQQMAAMAKFYGFPDADWSPAAIAALGLT